VAANKRCSAVVQVLDLLWKWQETLRSAPDTMTPEWKVMDCVWGGLVCGGSVCTSGYWTNEIETKSARTPL